MRMLRHTKDSHKVPAWAVVYKPQSKCFTCLGHFDGPGTRGKCNKVIYWGRTANGTIIRAIRCTCGKWHLREAFLGQFGAISKKEGMKNA